LDTQQLEKSIHYSFQNGDLLKEALTHRSYLNENPRWHLPHNERLEFLGDAVLELIVTEALYQQYPEYTEGQLTVFRAALVNYQMLASISKNCELHKHILLSKGEARDNGRAREVILANAMESLIGAIYLDGGYGVAKTFVEQFVLSELKNVIQEGTYRDAKSLLQEKTQADLKVTPLYKVLEESGPDHQRFFVVGVYLGEKLRAKGSGFSKQEAEVEAAKEALKTFAS